jgi:hypothetical protein
MQPESSLPCSQGPAKTPCVTFRNKLFICGVDGLVKNIYLFSKPSIQ